ncbi:MAG: glycosyltransferase [Chloroflexota bacterium]
MILTIIILIFSTILIIHGLFSLVMMLYAWARPERLDVERSPTDLPPKTTFTIIIPARHEARVIAQTIHGIWQTTYPKDLIEIAIVCEANDHATIDAANSAIAEIDTPQVRLITFDDGPINKPHGLNIALAQTRHEIVTIFDAEDDVHPDLFQLINSTLQHNEATIIQSGVQLMDFQSSWYAPHNVVEYYFWFKSQLHYNSAIGAVPLGGNTVFIKRALLEQIGGWDEQCLTEDADIGVRLSALGQTIETIYDPIYATREETPATVMAFIKQRTRWSQGFLQILNKGAWRRLAAWKQRWLMGYTLSAPFLQAILVALLGPTIFIMFAFDVPIWIAMISLIPAYILGFQFVIRLVGLFEFATDYGLSIRLWDVIRFTVGFLPYQVLLAIGAVRAIYRHITGLNVWEKTEHYGAHRR